jgi:hypothetical protein
MKRLILFVICAVLVLPTLGQAKDYKEYLKSLEKDMARAGTHVDAYARNPFQTGTALKDYYLNEKQLLLERDTWFQMKANKLETTENVADYHHRVKILRAHANNMLLHLLRVLKKENEGDEQTTEEDKHEKTLEEIIEECNADSQCVADRLQNPETSLENVIVDNFNLASEVFKQMPFMHILEVNSIYQLVQLMYVEIFYAQNRLSRVEFELFAKKQIKLAKEIEDNDNLSPKERDLHTAMVKNLVNKWKKRILQRKYDSKLEFKKKALEIFSDNQKIAARIKQIRDENPELFEEKDKPVCHPNGSTDRICRPRDRDDLKTKFRKIARAEYDFLNEPEMKLPKKFWKVFAK